MTIMEQVDRYGDLLDKKKELEDQLKDVKGQLDEEKDKLYKMMVDEECPVISRNGFRYSLQEKNRYSKLGDEKLAAAGVDFFEVLREEGFGDLITETVNANTLNSTMKAYVEENGELSEELAEVIGVFESYDITKKKETVKAGKKKKGA